MSDSATITLEKPVDVGGENITRLTMRAPRVRDQLLVAKKPISAAEQEVEMFANLCEVGPEVIQELHLKDYKQVQQAYQGFLS